MIVEVLVNLYERDLRQLRREIESYRSDGDLWQVEREIKNSGGNLALHLIGNLNHFIGATLGGSGYVRDRDTEFATKDVSRDDLLRMIDETIKVVSRALSSLDDEDLASDFPTRVFDRTDSTAWMLTHLLSHLNYHLGQINYHRRLTSTS